MKINKRIIHVVGVNSFYFEDLSLFTQNLFLKINNIAVPETFFNEIKKWSSKHFEEKNFFISKSDYKLIQWLESMDNDVILISRGDPLWYGIGRILLKNFSQEELLFYPSKTCVQLAFSKLKKPWQDVKTLSLHGRDSSELIRSLSRNEKSIAILTDPKNNSLELIRRNLIEMNLEHCYEFWLIEEIGSDKEKISLISSKEKLPKEISILNLVVLLKKELIDQKLSLPLFGINDKFFKTFNDRPNLLTKRDIRIQLLADLELPVQGTLFDIGAGSGTIGLEALRIRPKLKLICIDKRLGSQLLIQENSKRLGVSPLSIFEGDVKKYIRNGLDNYFSNSNRIIIGGCNKETKFLVIRELTKFLKKDDIIVMPLITFEILQEIFSTLNEFNFDTSIRLVQTYNSISVGEGTRFEPNNPVFIIKGKKY